MGGGKLGNQPKTHHPSILRYRNLSIKYHRPPISLSSQKCLLLSLLLGRNLHDSRLWFVDSWTRRAPSMSHLVYCSLLMAIKSTAPFVTDVSGAMVFDNLLILLWLIMGIKQASYFLYRLQYSARLFHFGVSKNLDQFPRMFAIPSA